MKVLLINGSPHQYGCTYTALKEVADSLNRNDVATEIYHIGAAPIRGCVGCGSCFATGKCVFDNDGVNEISRRLVEFDGIVVGSPGITPEHPGSYAASWTDCSTAITAAVRWTGRSRQLWSPAEGEAPARLLTESTNIL